MVNFHFASPSPRPPPKSVPSSAPSRSTRLVLALPRLNSTALSAILSVIFNYLKLLEIIVADFDTLIAYFVNCRLRFRFNRVRFLFFFTSLFSNQQRGGNGDLINIFVLARRERNLHYFLGRLSPFRERSDVKLENFSYR